MNDIIGNTVRIKLQVSISKSANQSNMEDLLLSVVNDDFFLGKFNLGVG